MRHIPIWIPIGQLPPYDDMRGDEQRFIVWNGVDRGEAKRKNDYSEWDGESETIPSTWGWSHRSTCDCCYSPMDPQPIAFMLLPEGPG